MCGIAGIISRDKRTISKQEIKAMLNLISHRGPDGEGLICEEGLALGHRRLAIIDLSDSGKQPMNYLDRYVIVYNGEIYNYLELRSDLEKEGYKFRTETDTEVVMAGYDFWGTKCLNKFNGMWSFLIFDRKKKKYFISRDQFGKKPFYYFRTDRNFIFASEIKSILSHPDVLVEPNLPFLEDYLKTLYKGYLKETAFRNIYRFDAASYFEGGINELFHSFEPKRYWELKPNLSQEKFNRIKAREYAQKYYELLKDAVKIRMRADVKVGSALSGGLDSSSIVYLVNQFLKEKKKEELQETFSSVYKAQNTKTCDESEYIDLISKSLKVNSNQIEPKENDVPREYQKMIWHLENPPENSLMSSWHTFKLVSSTKVKVTLDGQGADEQLAGYEPYVFYYISSLPLFEAVKESILFLKRMSSQARYFIKRGLIISFFKSIFGEKFTQLVLKEFYGKDFLKLNLNQRLASDTEQNLITLINFADRTSMAFGIESRMPFMDYRLVEFLASVPVCYKMRNGWTKYLARLAFDGKLPDQINWRKDKMGWPIPENTWFEGGLKNWLSTKIRNSRLAQALSIDYRLTDSSKLGTKIKELNLSLFEDMFLNNRIFQNKLVRFS